MILLWFPLCLNVFDCALHIVFEILFWVMDSLWPRMKLLCTRFYKSMMTLNQSCGLLGVPGSMNLNHKSERQQWNNHSFSELLLLLIFFSFPSFICSASRQLFLCSLRRELLPVHLYLPKLMWRCLLFSIGWDILA